ncbi:MAG: hypothetical protein LUC37_02555 [Prevotella sp.]|nr:hypothetical protein [Prevotella sp.]
MSTVAEWQQDYVTVDRKFESKVNEDLDKVIIGEGSLALDGNYTVEGIDRGDGYISF